MLNPQTPMGDECNTLQFSDNRARMVCIIPTKHLVPVLRYLRTLAHNLLLQNASKVGYGELRPTLLCEHPSKQIFQAFFVQKVFGGVT